MVMLAATKPIKEYITMVGTLSVKAVGMVVADIARIAKIRIMPATAIVSIPCPTYL